MNEWLHHRRTKSKIRFDSIPFTASNEWRYESGSLRHATGGFFSIEGVAAHAALPGFDGWQQPIINQPEVGILGFVATPGTHGHDWLVQAKAEPGNVGGVQLAPTVQATYSNYMRRHGGAPTLYLDHFTGGGPLLSDSLQSEQGTRFLRKFNRNAVCGLKARPVTAGDNFAWLATAELRHALVADYAINTDARSVLVSAPWHLLADNGRPFQNGAAIHLAGDLLANSWLAPVPVGLLDEVRRHLSAVRQLLDLRLETCSLDTLSGWQFDDRSIQSADPRYGLEVRHYAVEAPDRERAAWDQPLVLSRAVDTVVLFCRPRNGQLEFMLRPNVEIGLTGGAEFGPSYKHETLLPHPTWLADLVAAGNWRELLSAEQSDEGGRFMQSRCRYVVAELPADWQAPEEGSVVDDPIWVSASALAALCRAPGILTNEARSVISLLLSLA
ncbi:MAG: hypothetical protein EP335_16600 [Alphaproteobacteria bacterium]|nr:MAG: hypothetical protein EP335_16600 [Alphaproteobacteria bacterium]